MSSPPSGRIVSLSSSAYVVLKEKPIILFHFFPFRQWFTDVLVRVKKILKVKKVFTFSPTEHTCSWKRLVSTSALKSTPVWRRATSRGSHICFIYASRPVCARENWFSTAALLSFKETGAKTERFIQFKPVLVVTQNRIVNNMSICLLWNVHSCGFVFLFFYEWQW